MRAQLEWTRRSRVAVALVPIVLALAAQPAGAATRVSTTATGDVVIEDTSGSNDAIAVGQERSGSTFFVSVTELRSGAAAGGGYLPTQALQAGSGCVADIISGEAPAIDDGHPRVRCQVQDLHLTITASLGDGNDVIRFSRFAARQPFDAVVDGGRGNDNIAGCDGADVLTGGEGDDIVRSRSDDLIPGGGGDFIAHDAIDPMFCRAEALRPPPPAPTHMLFGGPGNDTLIDADGQPDVYDGGDGVDTAQLDTFGPFDGLSDPKFIFFWNASIDGVANDIARAVDRNQIRPTDNVLANVENLIGNGKLVGSSAHNRLQGGAYDDLLIGGSPPASRQVVPPVIPIPPLTPLLGLDDVLIGGKGNDTLSGEGGNDSLSGEEGDDILNGGDQNDTIAGGAGKDRIRGGAGSDSLGGDAGNDDLDGEGGTDRYSAGSGDDTLDSRDGEKDTVDCGTGVDSVDADLKDSVQDSCENLDQGAVKEGPNVRITSKSLRLAADGTARVRLHCPRQLHIRCRGSLALVRSGGTKRTSGVARYAVRPGRSIAVRLRIGGADRRALKRGRKLSRRVRSVEHGTHGPKTTIRLVTVRA